MTLSIFNPCSGTADEIEIPDAASSPGEDEWATAREARMAEIRSLLEEIAENVPPMTGAAMG